MLEASPWSLKCKSALQTTALFQTNLMLNYIYIKEKVKKKRALKRCDFTVVLHSLTYFHI